MKSRLQSNHVRRLLAAVKHRGFEVIVKKGSVIAIQGGSLVYNEIGGAVLCYRNPAKLLQTIRAHF